MEPRYAYVPRGTLAVAGAAALLCSFGALSACSSSSDAETAARISATSATMDPAAAKAAADKAAALKAATDKAAAEQDAAVKEVAKKYVVKKKSEEIAASRSHPVAKAAAACGVPLAYVYAAPSGSRIGIPDMPRPGDIWRVKATSPRSPGMIIYWPDGGSVLCR